MKASREDRLESDSGKGGFPTKHLLLAVAILAVVVVLWRALSQEADEPPPAPVAVEPVVVEPPPLPPAEDIPPPPPPEPVVVETETPVEPPPPEPALPTLEESDPLAREQLVAVGATAEFAALAQQENIVQQGAALIDGASRGLVLRKLLPLSPPEGAFAVIERDSQMFLDPAGYGRFDAYAQAIAGLNTDALVQAFHLMRPLYEEAYGQLGLDPNEFDNALIRVLDRVLATPEIEGAIPLSRKSVMYEYADPQLEALSDVQKQLLRMGPDNIRLIKSQAQQLRDGLLNQ